MSQRCSWASALALIVAWPAAPQATPVFERYAGNPLLEGSTLGLDSIMFPSVIRLPEWAAKPGGAFLMYYASHSGKAIWAAVADRPEGPWRPLPKPVLTIDRTPFPHHISSPDVLVIPEQKLFYLYFHGAYLDLPEVGNGLQLSSVSVSKDPAFFPATKRLIITKGVNSNYLRVFRKGAEFYAVGRQARLFRSRDGFHWEGGPYLLSWERLADLTNLYPAEMIAADISDNIRHVGLYLHQGGDRFDCYFSVGRNAKLEEIQKVTIDCRGHWQGWAPTEMPRPVLSPKEPADFTPNGRGDVRNPFVLKYADRLYMYYVAGAEKSIRLAIR